MAPSLKFPIRPPRFILLVLIVRLTNLIDVERYHINFISYRWCDSWGRSPLRNISAL